MSLRPSLCFPFLTLETFSRPRNFFKKEKRRMKMMTKETRLPFVYTSARVKFFLPRKGSSRPTVSRSRGGFFVDRHLFFFKAFRIGIGFDLFERVYPFYIFFDLITFTLKGFSGRTSNWWWLLYTPGQHTHTHSHTQHTHFFSSLFDFYRCALSINQETFFFFWISRAGAGARRKLKNFPE